MAQRREIAMQLGATGVIDPTSTDPVEELRNLTRIGPDVVLEACGVPDEEQRDDESDRDADDMLPQAASGARVMAVARGAGTTAEARSLARLSS